MKFKLDENLPAAFAERLREMGHDALSVLEETLGGERDEIISKVCREEERILVTLDLDFADIRHYPPDEHHGIIVLRLRQQDRESVLEMVPRLLQLLKTEPINKLLWIVDEDRTRIRGG